MSKRSEEKERLRRCVCHKCRYLMPDTDANGEPSVMYGVCSKNGMRVAQYHNTPNPQCPKKIYG